MHKFLVKIYQTVTNTMVLCWNDFVVRPFLCRRPKYNKRYDISICAIFKNESPYMCEWIEFHNMIGVDHFYLYNNFSEDNYLEVLQPYIDSGLVTLVEFPVEQGQVKAYKNFYETYRNETQWVSFLDLDEYFCPRSCNSLRDWIRGYEQYPVIQIYWKMFGTSGNMVHDHNKLIIEQYHVSWDHLYHCGKCLVNTDYDIANFDASTLHGTVVYYSFLGMRRTIRPVNIFRRSSIGEGIFRTCWLDESKATIQINHYWSKAWNVYDAKRKSTDCYFKQNPKAKISYFLGHEHHNCSTDYNIYRFVMQLKLRLANISDNDIWGNQLNINNIARGGGKSHIRFCYSCGFSKAS